MYAAVEDIHHHGFINGDIHAENFLFKRTDDGVRVVLSDLFFTLVTDQTEDEIRDGINSDFDLVKDIVEEMNMANNSPTV